jgi:hypothetical protein
MLTDKVKGLVYNSGDWTKKKLGPLRSNCTRWRGRGSRHGRIYLNASTSSNVDYKMHKSCFNFALDPAAYWYPFRRDVA